MSLLIAPNNAYLGSLIIPEGQYREQACERAFGAEGRMKSVVDRTWVGGYSFRPFSVRTTKHEFEYARPRPDTLDSAKGSNISAVWTDRRKETLIGGVLQGRKQTDPAGRSMLSRRYMWEDMSVVIQELQGRLAHDVAWVKTYQELKASCLLADRQEVKAAVQRMALQGWHPNHKDDFSLQDEIT